MFKEKLDIYFTRSAQFSACNNLIKKNVEREEQRVYF